MELSPLVLIIWGELTFFLFGGLLLILMNDFMKRRQRAKAVKNLLGKVKSDRQRRLTEIKNGLSAYGLEGEVLEKQVKAIDKQELRLYQRISTMYRLHSDGMLSNIDIAVEASSKPYYQLDLNLAGGDHQVTEASPEADHSALDKLRQQNEDLQAELSVTMDTIGRMLSEYSSMFGADNEGSLDKGKIMEAFEVDDTDINVAVDDDLDILDDVETDELLEVEDVAMPSDDLVVEEPVPSDGVDLFDEDLASSTDEEGDISAAALEDVPTLDSDIAVEETPSVDEKNDVEISDIDDLFEEDVASSTEEAVSISDDVVALEDDQNVVSETVVEETASVDETKVDEIPDIDDLFEEVADDIEVDSLDDVVDLETDLMDESDDFVEIEGMDDLDIDSLIESSDEKS